MKYGHARFVDPHTLQISRIVSGDEGTTQTETITANYVLIATGSRPRELPRKLIQFNSIQFNAYAL